MFFGSRKNRTPWEKLSSGIYVPPLLNFSRWYPCPDCCDTGTGTGTGESDCPYCTGSVLPEEFEVVIAGVTNSVCADCLAVLNGTFVVSYLYYGEMWWYQFGKTLWGCQWIYESEDDYCGTPGDLRLTLFYDNPNYILEALFGTHWTDWTAWQVSFGSSAPDCSSFDDLSLSPAGATYYCNNASSTCAVSAV